MSILLGSSNWLSIVVYFLVFSLSILGIAYVVYLASPSGASRALQNKVKMKPLAIAALIVVGLVLVASLGVYLSGIVKITGGNSTAETTCTISAEGTGFYVTVLSDSGQPIQNAKVTGNRFAEIDGGSCHESIGTYSTNSTGSVLITPNIGSYYQLSIVCQSKIYTANVFIESMTSTYVTISVPSGSVNIDQIPFGGCMRNANGTTCPG